MQIHTNPSLYEMSCLCFTACVTKCRPELFGISTCRLCLKIPVKIHDANGINTVSNLALKISHSSRYWMTNSRFNTAIYITLLKLHISNWLQIILLPSIPSIPSIYGWRKYMLFVPNNVGLFFSLENRCFELWLLLQMRSVEVMQLIRR